MEAENDDKPTNQNVQTTTETIVKPEPDVKSKEKHLRILVSQFPHIDTMVNIYLQMIYIYIYILLIHLSSVELITHENIIHVLSCSYL